jgi:hypothetical protein
LKPLQHPIMKKTSIRRFIQRPRVLALTAGVAVLAAPAAYAQTAEEFQQLKAAVQQMQKTIDGLNAKIADLEKAKAAPPPQAPPAAAAVPATNALARTSVSLQTMEKIAEGQTVSVKSQTDYRRTLNDQQEAAARPKDYTLDPQYQGFIPVPNTPVLIKFNAKPHLDMTMDNQNTGNKYRFAPALFPLKGDPAYGGGEQFNVNANATQLRVDVRAPEMAGDFRFYYQNDFFGSDTSDMKYRLQHLYGQFYGFVGGFTYSVWEDPDIWPDTVDYEGPNSVIFARRPVAHYTYAFNDQWNATVGVEKPGFGVDGAANTLTSMPDLGFNARWEKSGVGHVQFSSLYRDLGARSATGDDQHVFGWGINLGAGLELGKRDSLQLLGVYGEGVGGLANDAFQSLDAAFSSGGSLEALPFYSAMIGLTHKWSDQWRSTASYGYVNVDNTLGQAATAYHFTHYASLNLIYQLRKHLSIGLEGLYGFKEARSGLDSGDIWRVQLGMVYSLFD